MNVEMKLGRWQARDGNVHEINIHNPTSTYPWASEESETEWGSDGFWIASDLETEHDLIRYLGPLELSPSIACAEAGPAGDLSTVSTEDPQESLRRMRAHCNALDRWLSAYKALVAQNERTKDDLEEAIKMLEKEVEG